MSNGFNHYMHVNMKAIGVFSSFSWFILSPKGQKAERMTQRETESKLEFLNIQEQDNFIQRF